MKVEITKNGWKEISTKYIKIEQINTKSLMMVCSWINSNEKLFPDVQRRKRCDMCRTKWKDIPLLENVNLVFTNCGNKMVCNSCCNKLKGLDIEKPRQNL